MKILPLLSIFALALTANAQTEATTEAQQTAEPTVAEVEQSLKNLNFHLQQRQQRVTNLREELVRKDEQVERTIERIINMLKHVSDSADSGTKTMRMKQDIIDGLSKTIERYQNKRRELAIDAVSNKPTLDKEVSEAGMKAMDEKIQKRVDQILDLSKSLTTSNEYRKFNDHYKESRQRLYTRNRTAENQARKTTTRAGQVKGDLLDAIQSNIENLKRRNIELENMMENQLLDDDQRGMIAEQIRLNEEVIDQRYDQLEAALTSQGADPGSTQKIGLRDAMEMDRLIKDAASDLKWDFNSVFRTYSELVTELQKVSAIEQTITAREAWLTENSATATE